MKNLFTALCLVSASATSAVADIVHQNSRWGFEVLQPSGWTSIPPGPTPEAATVRFKMRSPEAGTVCNVVAMDAPSTRELTQAQINGAVSQGILANIAADEVRSIDPNVRRTSASIITVNGLPAQEVELRTTFPLPDKAKVDLAQISMAIAVPGRSYLVNCTTVQQSYERLKPEFRRIQRSLRIVPAR